MKCLTCKNECLPLKKPYHVSKDKFYDCYYCEKCQKVYTVISRCKECGGEAVRSRKIRKGDKIENGFYIPFIL